jgi:hypothetical protein
MRDAVAPGGHVGDATGFGVGVGVGLSVEMGEAVGVGVVVGVPVVTVADGVGAGVAVGASEEGAVGLAVTTAIGEPAPVGFPPPFEIPGRNPIMMAIAATPATATSARPAMVTYGIPDRGLSCTAAVADSSASRVPRIYRGQLTWTRCRQTSSCCRSDRGNGSPKAAHR